MIKRSNKKYNLGIVGCVATIIILTIFELPVPIGFETRPQNNVSMGWLILFLAIVVTEIAAIACIFKKPKWGSIFGMMAGVLNILQIIADQLHLMQPEVAPLGYTLLEYAVGIFSVVLIYMSLNYWKSRIGG